MTLDTMQIKALHRRAADRRLHEADQHDIDDILERVAKAHETGWSVGEGLIVSDASAVSAPTGFENNGRALVAAIAGPTARMKANFEKYGCLLRDMRRRL